MKSWGLSIINTEYEHWKVHMETFSPAGDSLGWAAGESLNIIDTWNEECVITLRSTSGTTAKKMLGKAFVLSAVSDPVCVPAWVWEDTKHWRSHKLKRNMCYYVYHSAYLIFF